VKPRRENLKPPFAVPSRDVGHRTESVKKEKVAVSPGRRVNQPDRKGILRGEGGVVVNVILDQRRRRDKEMNREGWRSKRFPGEWREAVNHSYGAKEFLNGNDPVVISEFRQKSVGARVTITALVSWGAEVE